MSRLSKLPSTDFIFVLKIYGKQSERYIEYYVKQHRGKWYIYTSTDNIPKKLRQHGPYETQQLAEDFVRSIKKQVEEYVSNTGKETHSQD